MRVVNLLAMFAMAVSAIWARRISAGIVAFELNIWCANFMFSSSLMTAVALQDSAF